MKIYTNHFWPKWQDGKKRAKDWRGYNILPCNLPFELSQNYNIEKKVLETNNKSRPHIFYFPQGTDADFLFSFQNIEFQADEIVYVKKGTEEISVDDGDTDVRALEIPTTWLATEGEYDITFRMERSDETILSYAKFVVFPFNARECDVYDIVVTTKYIILEFDVPFYEPYSVKLIVKKVGYATKEISGTQTKANQYKYSSSEFYSGLNNCIPVITLGTKNYYVPRIINIYKEA